MRFIIRHETSSYMRLQLLSGPFTPAQGQVLHYALSHLKGVSDVRLYPATGGVSFNWRGNRETILCRLRSLQFQNVKMFGDQIEETIGNEELNRRKLSPEVKARLRRKVLLETAADLIMPAPVQVGYHLYQLVTLRDM